MHDYWERYPYGSVPKDTKHRDEMQGNILILFRKYGRYTNVVLDPNISVYSGKLREGLLSTRRNDAFVLEGMYVKYISANAD